MKTNSITLASGQYDHTLEELIRQKEATLKELARKNAIHFAKRNLPSPTGDSLDSFTGELKTGHEHLGAEVFQRLQPQTHFPEAKMDSDFLKEKEKQLDIEIKERSDKNLHDEYELQNYHPGSVPMRVVIALLLTLIILIGEVFYNTKSFQVIVENMLFALGLSFSVSISVLIASHLAAFMYKGAKTKIRRWMVVVCSLAIVTIVFSALAMIRSVYLERHGVHISPVYFVVFNLFFFMISSFLSFFILPTWIEVKEQFSHLKLYSAIKRRKKEIKELKRIKETMKHEHHVTSKERARIIYYANYQAERIRKMYAESVEIFKGTNLIYRTDKQTPDCFTQKPRDPDIQDITMTYISQNGKAS